MLIRTVSDDVSNINIKGNSTRTVMKRTKFKDNNSPQALQGNRYQIRPEVEERLHPGSCC